MILFPYEYGSISAASQKLIDRLFAGRTSAMDVRGRGEGRGPEPERAAQPRGLFVKKTLRPGDKPADAHWRS